MRLSHKLKLLKAYFLAQNRTKIKIRKFFWIYWFQKRAKTLKINNYPRVKIFMAEIEPL